MLKIFSHLKKRWYLVLVIIALLCIEAWTDLELPSYSSKIVNVGIQAGRNREHKSRCPKKD